MPLASRLRSPWTLRALSAGTMLALPAYVLGAYRPAFNTTRTPLEGLLDARSRYAARPALSRRLVFVVVDGLSYAQAQRVPELVELAARGAFRPMTAAFPSFTSPAITAFVTGLSPRDSGMRLNGPPIAVTGVDSIGAAAADVGVDIAVRSRGWEPFAGLLRAPPSSDVKSGRIVVAFETARAWRPPADRPSTGRCERIELVYVGEPDDAAHAHGTASPEFARARELAGAVAARIAASLDLERDSIVLASDHGHIERGGHGGVEPEALDAFLLAAGASIARGASLGPRPLRDVAPTLATLAGVPAPSTSLGAPMLDLLDVEASDRARLAAGPFLARTRLLCAAAPNGECQQTAALGARLSAGDAEALAPAAALAERLDRAREATLDAAERKGQTTRAVASGAVVALALGVVARSTRKAHALRGGALALTHVALYAAFMAARGYRPSWSALPLVASFVPDAAGAAFLAAFTTLGAAWRWRWLQSTSTARTLLACVLAPYALIAAYAGCDPRALPTPLSGVLVFLTAPLAFGAATTVAIWSLFATRD